ncbi:MAG: hypothetical protein O7F76_11485 [Planctomycetota bacterium]|nr:hypothetical protein [Planctomycetota bacterium]
MAAITINWEPDSKTLRQFGAIGVVAFSAFALLAYFQIWVFANLPIRSYYVLGPLAAYCGVFSLASPGLLRPLFLLLSVAGYPIGFAVSHVVMFLVYYLMFAPIGIVFKIIGRDALHRQFEPSAETYWVRRRPPASVKRYFRQF